MKYKFFEKNISPREFRKCRMSDIQDLMDIGNEIEIKMKREQKVKSLIANMK